jgi:acyl-CoA reductase-like NAD-dependent aldehyde dehydrogenase
MGITATQHKILIGGDFADAASGETMEVIAPATGETIAEVPRCPSTPGRNTRSSSTSRSRSTR